MFLSPQGLSPLQNKTFQHGKRKEDSISSFWIADGSLKEQIRKVICLEDIKSTPKTEQVCFSFTAPLKAIVKNACEAVQTNTGPRTRRLTLQGSQGGDPWVNVVTSPSAERLRGGQWLKWRHAPGRFEFAWEFVCVDKDQTVPVRRYHLTPEGVLKGRYDPAGLDRSDPCPVFFELCGGLGMDWLSV